MNAWDDPDINIYTDNYEKWAPYMNLTTEEWNMPFIPVNVVAIPGSIDDDKYDFPDGTFVIENSARATLVSRDIEKLIFGVASGVAIAILLVWLWWHSKDMATQSRILRGKEDEDEGAELQPNSNASGSSTMATKDETTFGMKAKEFEKELGFFYDPVITMPELAPKVQRGEKMNGEYFESINELMRKMFKIDLEIVSMRHEDDAESRAKSVSLGQQSDAILEELHRLMAWVDEDLPHSLHSWTEKEQDLAAQVKYAVRGENSYFPPGRYEAMLAGANTTSGYGANAAPKQNYTTHEDELRWQDYS